MKIAVIGSRGLSICNLEKYLPAQTEEIITGGAKGVDTSAMEYANQHGIKLTVFLPEYGKFRRNAPLIRNRKIVECADEVVAFWDGKSRGTRQVIEFCQSIGKAVTIYRIEQN